MRHVLALLGTALVLAGCSTEDGLRAQELLERAEAAQLALDSATFEGGLTFSFGGERGTMQMRGASVKGEGEWFALDAVGIPGAGATQMQMVMRDGRARSTRRGCSSRSQPASVTWRRSSTRPT